MPVNMGYWELRMPVATVCAAPILARKGSGFCWNLALQLSQQKLTRFPSYVRLLVGSAGLPDTGHRRLACCVSGGLTPTR